MNLAAWQSKVREQLQSSAAWLRKATPGMAYGALATCTLLPLVAAAQQGDYAAIGTLYQIIGGIGGNLIANQIQSWKDRSEAEVVAEIQSKATADPAWREAIDQLLKAIETPKVAQAVLSEADWDRFAGLLRQDVSQIGSSLVVSGDWVAGDKFDGDKIDGDKVLGHKAERDFYYLDQRTTAPDPAQATLAAQRQAQDLYLTRLRTYCHAVPLSAMGGDATAGDEITLDKVYIDLDTESLVTEKRGESNREQQRPLSAREIAQRTARLVLLGQPGSGKSSFVRQWIAELIYSHQQQAPFDGLAADCLPVLTILRDLTISLATLDLLDLSADERDERLVECLRQQWQRDLKRFGGAGLVDQLETALVQGRLLVVLDGLDEMPPPTRLRVRQAVAALLKTYPQIAQIIVTCRIRSYQGESVLPNFTAHTLADFDEKKVRAFVAGWYHAQLTLGRLSTDQATEQIEDLQRAAWRPGLRKMAANPMLLTTMAIIHQKRTRLPDQRVRLYDEAVKILLNRWQESKGVTVSAQLQELLNQEDKVRRLLEQLAYVAQRQTPNTRQRRDESTDLARRDLLDLLEGELGGNMPLAVELLDYVDQRAGLLVGRGGEEHSQRPQLYAFAHRTFQEYLAGCRLLEGTGNNRGVGRVYLELTKQGDSWQLAAQLGAEELIHNRTGAGSLLDLMYELCPTTKPRNQAGWRANLWSGQMATLLPVGTIEADKAGHDGGSRYLQRVIARLCETLAKTRLPALERAEAGRVLAKLGDPRPEVMTLAGMEFCLVPAGPFVMGSKKGNGPGEDPRAYDWETPQHRYDIKHAYWLARYPLTNAQYDRFIQAGGYANPSYWTEAAAHGYWQDGAFKGDNDDEPRTQPMTYGEPFHLPNHPVVGISWYEALAYTRWLTEGLPQGWQVRLPSEAEWEKGARGGLQIPAQTIIAALAKVTGTLQSAGHLIDNPNPIRRYTWGDQIDAEKLNYNETNIGSTSAVGAFPGGVSPYGVEELNGNVLEWCSTQWLADYTDYQQKATDAPDANAGRVVRGGSFAGLDLGARAPYRSRYNPDFRVSSFGVRLVLSPSPLGSVPLSSEI